MAQGYVVPFDGGCQSLEDAAEEHFNTLLQRCFFQNVEEDEYGDVMSIKIHDLMHDVAQDVGKKEICVLRSESNMLGDKIRHVYVERDISLETVNLKSKIRSYVHDCCRKDLMNLQMIDSLMCLRVLDLENSDFKTLPDWISKLLHLRYLNLSSNSRLASLPDSITKLHNLQTLLLKRCFHLRELPKELGKLKKLRHLDLSYCEELTSMPPSMENLSNLRMLPYIVVGKGSDEQCDGALKHLESFTNIKDSIRIDIGNNYKDVEGMNIKEGGYYLKSTKYLTSLELRFCRDDTAYVEQEGMMEKLEPNSNLKEFILDEYQGRSIPRWGTTQLNWAISFPYLVTINMVRCRNLERLPSLSKLRYLKSLVLKDLKLEYGEHTSHITSGDDSTTLFPSLESLEIHRLERLKEWWKGEDEGHILSRRFIFPKLSHLEIKQCPSFKLFPLSPVQEDLRSPEISAKQKVRGLNKLAIDRVDYLTSITTSHQSSISEDRWKSLNQSLRSITFQDLEDDHLPKAVNGAQHLTSLHTLKFLSCWNLEALPEWIGNLSSLQNLTISWCRSLTSLPESMSKLTSLQSIEILFPCIELAERCQRPDGVDWIKIQHVPNIRIRMSLFR